MKHVDIISNDWAHAEQLRVARCYVSADENTLEVDASTNAEGWREFVLGRVQGNAGARTPNQQLDELQERIRGDYLFATPPHDDDVCPYQSADAVGMTPVELHRSWGHGQFVEELGYWVRSTWERDYLLGLKAAGVEFEYESVRFDLGDATYIPDVHLVGSNVFIEITGWDKPGKAEKRERAADLYGFVLIVEARRPTETTIRDLVDRCKGVRPQ